MTAAYQRLGNSTELNGLLFKYKLAKILTFLSLSAVVIMALASIVFPDNVYEIFEKVAKANDDENGIGNSGGIKTATVCKLPTRLDIPGTQDARYTPPSPDVSLLKILQQVPTDEYQQYCQHWDPVYGFDDDIPYNVNGECGNWQKRYEDLHSQRMEQLERLKAGDFESFAHDDKPRYISYFCKKVPENSNRGCGGLADRMSGMISTFFFALLTQRAYLANWAPENPIPLEYLFEQPFVNWTHKPSELKLIFDVPDNELLGFQYVDTLNQNYDSIGKSVFPDGPSQDFEKLWNGTYVEVHSNRGYIVRTFDQSTRYTEQLQKMGLTKENAFGCLTDFLFRPSVDARRFLNMYRYLFSMKSVLSIGIQIRTNDNALANPELDHNNLEQWYYYIKCANELATAKRQSYHTRTIFFLITDSHKLREEFESMNNDEDLRRKYLGPGSEYTSLLVTGLPIEHVEPDQVAKYIEVEHPRLTSWERMVPGVNSALMENWLLSYTDYRVISPQGYGKLAAFHSKRDKTTVSIPRSPRRAKAMNCANPDVMDAYDFSWLSHQWSLG
ncbi:hypothetical protein DM01DRAFT_1384444 [Hesseltinella vesiculosa]|uniref:Proteophosphoglycan ppg4 n=1 Tax=Hesseltinella vesiculosa TaxID=101127 RepID=A0A1X2GD80_9FUNG|nr:hypothetical protein DM01DRAFT_1384444 [Hesseltinella vesiculosa]